MRVTVCKQDLIQAAENGLMSADQAEKLWGDLSARRAAPIRMLKFIYYLGAMLVIAAMTWFMNLGWNWLEGGGLCFIGLCYGALFFCSGYYVWRQKEFRLTAGFLVTVAVCMVPLAIFGLERWTGLWPTGDPGAYATYFFAIQGSWIVMELGTILIGLTVLYFIRFPFLIVPIAASVWFLAMDITMFLFGSGYAWQQKCWISLGFGALVLCVAYLLDRMEKRDFAFWLYLFGMLTFWGGLSLLVLGSEIGWLIFFFVNLLLMISAILIDRNVPMVFGTLGVFSYLGHLSYEIFRNSPLFPFSLSLIGVVMIALGIVYQKKRSQFAYWRSRDGRSPNEDAEAI